MNNETIKSKDGLRPNRLALLLPALLSLLVFSNSAIAKGEKIAILDFEVHDLTMNPAVEQEKERAATLRPLMQKALRETHQYEVVEIDPEIQQAADKGVGYIYDRPALAAELGAQVGADWIIVGRVHKATFLFVYFKALIVNVESGKLVSEQLIEVKGPQRKFTDKGVEALSNLIDSDIQELVNGS